MKRSVYETERELFAALLKEIRTEAGLLQKDVAERTGWDQGEISRFERGTRQLDFMQARVLLESMGSSVAIVDRLLTERLARGITAPAKRAAAAKKSAAPRKKRSAPLRRNADRGKRA